MLYIFSIS